MTRSAVKARRPREIELKFHLPEASRALVEAHPAIAAAVAEDHDLVSTYFDTPDRGLDRRGMSLRVRRDGATRTQTMKSRTNGRGVAAHRAEWERSIEQDVPQMAGLGTTPLLKAAADAIAGRLEPVFVTRIRRTRRLVRLGADTTVEVAFDVGEIEAGVAREPVSELEIELKSGRIEPLYRLAAALMGIAPLWLMSESKASRGWRLRSGQTTGACLAQAPRLNRKTSGETGFRRILSAALGHLTNNIGPVLRGDPEGLHQARIALGQARAALRLFGPCLDTECVGRFTDRLEPYGILFGAARDWDVFCLEALPAAMPDLSAERLQALNCAAEVERQRAHTAVAIALRERGFSELVLDLAVWTQAGVLATGEGKQEMLDQRLSSLAPALLDRAARTIRRRGRRIDGLSKDGRHRLRKALKRLTFDMEALEGLYPGRAVKRYRRRVQALESGLSAANDAVVMDRLAARLVAGGRPDLSRPVRAFSRWNRQRRRKGCEGLKAAMRAWGEASEFWS